MKPGGFQDVVQRQTIAGQSLSVNGLTLTPESRVLLVRFPWGALLWHRPTAVLLAWDGQVKSFPIVNITRALQFRLYGLGVIFIVLVGLIEFSRRRKQTL